MEFENVKNMIAEKDIQFIRVEVEDINAISKGVTLSVGHFLKSSKGFGIPYNIQVHKATAADEGVENTGVDSNGDAYMYVDMKTFQVLPWVSNTASILVDAKRLNNPESTLEVSSRVVCKRIIKTLEQQGMKIFGAFEYEFYVLDRETRTPSFNDIAVYTSFAYPKIALLIRDIFNSMKQIEIFPERLVVESGVSQFEITHNPAFGIKCADNAFRFRHLVKELTLKHGMLATFASKPFEEHSGSSGHFNHSLWSLDGNNIFFNADSERKMSNVMRHWLAGLQHHSAALMVFAAPTPNCYLRFGKSMSVPINRHYGFDDRTSAYRVKIDKGDNTYLESRRPGAAVNPYLYTAAVILAGLDGITNKMELIENNEPFTLPRTLPEAINCLRNDDVLVKGLGHKLIDNFTAIKLHEWEHQDNLSIKFRYVNI